MVAGYFNGASLLAIEFQDGPSPCGTVTLIEIILI
jgi:hypothetical protein